MTTPTRRRLRLVGVTSNLDAFGAQPALHLRLNLLQLLAGSGFESHHDHRLGVRRADQSPPVAEKDANAVNGQDLILRTKVFLRLFDNPELFVIWTIDADFRRRNETRHIGEQLPNALAGVGDNAKETR